MVPLRSLDTKSRSSSTMLYLLFVIILLFSEVAASFRNVRARLKVRTSTRPYQGLLEVSIDGSAWGTVCDDGFDEDEALVACRTIFPTGNVLGATLYDETGSGTILMDNVNCHRDATSLSSCSYTREHDCSHSEDIGLRCNLQRNITDVRLLPSNPAVPYSGLLQVKLFGHNEWGTVCDDIFSQEHARLACISAGYPNTVRAFEFDALGSGPIFMDDVRCESSAKSFYDCTFITSHNCNHHEDVGVFCLPSLTQTASETLATSVTTTLVQTNTEMSTPTTSVTRSEGSTSWSPSKGTPTKTESFASPTPSFASPTSSFASFTSTMGSATSSIPFTTTTSRSALPTSTMSVSPTKSVSYSSTPSISKPTLTPSVTATQSRSPTADTLTVSAEETESGGGGSPTASATKTRSRSSTGSFSPSSTKTKESTPSAASTPSHTLSLDLPTPVPSTPSPPKEEKISIDDVTVSSSVATSAAGAAAVAAASTPASATVMAKATAALSTIECALAEDNDRPETMEHPIQMALGSGKMRYYAGSALASALVSLALYLTVIIGRAMLWKRMVAQHVEMNKAHIRRWAIRKMRLHQMLTGRRRPIPIGSQRHRDLERQYDLCCQQLEKFLLLPTNAPKEENEGTSQEPLTPRGRLRKKQKKKSRASNYIQRRTWEHAAVLVGILEWVSILSVIALSMFGPNVFGAATTAVLHATAYTDWVGGVLAILIITGIFVHVGYVLNFQQRAELDDDEDTNNTPTAMAKHSADGVSKNDIEPLEVVAIDDDCVPSGSSSSEDSDDWRTAKKEEGIPADGSSTGPRHNQPKSTSDRLQVFEHRSKKLFNRLEFRNRPAHPLFCQTFGPYFDGGKSVSSKRIRNYMLIELSVACAASMLAGIRPNSSCIPVAVVLVLLSIAHLLYVSIVRPYQTVLDTSCQIIFGANQTAIGILVVLAISGHPYPTIIAGCMFLQVIALFLQLFIQILWQATIHWIVFVKQDRAEDDANGGKRTRETLEQVLLTFDDNIDTGDEDSSEEAAVAVPYNRDIPSPSRSSGSANRNALFTAEGWQHLPARRQSFSNRFVEANNKYPPSPASSLHLDSLSLSGMLDFDGGSSTSDSDDWRKGSAQFLATSTSRCGGGLTQRPADDFCASHRLAIVPILPTESTTTRGIVHEDTQRSTSSAPAPSPAPPAKKQKQFRHQRRLDASTSRLSLSALLNGGSLGSVEQASSPLLSPYQFAPKNSSPVKSPRRIEAIDDNKERHDPLL